MKKNKSIENGFTIIEIIIASAICISTIGIGYSLLEIALRGNKIDETFVKWDQEKGRCFAGFTVSGNNVGVDESITVSGEALSFLSTGIDTRVYFI